MHSDSEQLAEAMGRVRDLERLMMKISSGYASPRDVVALRFSLEELPSIKKILSRIIVEQISSDAAKIEEMHDVVQKIAKTLVDEPPARIQDGGIIREGVHHPLDELRILSRDGKTWLARYQTQIRDETNIKTLKVGYNKIFGYFIEVSKGQAEKMPYYFPAQTDADQ